MDKSNIWNVYTVRVPIQVFYEFHRKINELRVAEPDYPVKLDHLPLEHLDEDGNVVKVTKE